MEKKTEKYKKMPRRAGQRIIRFNFLLKFPLIKAQIKKKVYFNLLSMHYYYFNLNLIL